MVFEQTRFGQVVQSAPRRVVHSTPAAVAAKSAFRNAQRGFSLAGQIWQLEFLAASRLTLNTAAGLVVSSFLRALRDGSSTPAVVFNNKLLISWGTPYLSGGRWHVPCDSIATDWLPDTALVIPVTDDLTEVAGAAYETFFAQTFSLPPVATSPQAQPPFVILAWSALYRSGTIPPEPEIERWAGFASLYVP